MRAKRELEAMDEQLHQAELRAKAAKTKSSESASPKGLLQAIAKSNDFDLNDRGQRHELLEVLDKLASAPTVTISFAVDPSDAFTAKIVEWFRANIHPSLLI